MPLSFTERTTYSPTGVGLLGTDQSHRTVMVYTTSENVKKYGIERVKQAASRKYDAGSHEPDGTVVVHENDLFE